MDFFGEILSRCKLPQGNMIFQLHRPLEYMLDRKCKSMKKIGKRSSHRTWPALLVCALLFGTFNAAKADCFDDAGLYHQVNPWILRAIAAEESGFRPNTVVKNSNNSLDRGMTGINSVHLPELAKFGIGATDLMDACKSIYVAAWHLRKKMTKYGNNYKAVGAYHSETPDRLEVYASKIRRRIVDWTARGWIR